MKVRSGTWLCIVLSILISSVASVVNAQEADGQSPPLQKVETDAKKDFPNTGYSESIKQEAGKKTQEIDAAASSESERINNAAINFMSFYLMSVRTRFAYCANVGEDISPFVDGFKQANKASYDKAKIVLNRINVTEDQVFAKWKSLSEEFNEKNMIDVATRQKLTVRQLCEQIRDHPEPRIALLMYAQFNPAGYEILSHVR